MEYLGVPQEAPAIIDKSRPPAYWPSSNGELVVENLVVRYAPNLPAVLRNLSFTVKPSEKVGVVSALTLSCIHAQYVWDIFRSEGQDLVSLHIAFVVVYLTRLTLAGKSTLALSLLRMVEPSEGRIL